MKKARGRRYRLVIDVYWIVKIYLLNWQREHPDPVATIQRLISESRLKEAASRLAEETTGDAELHRTALQLQERIHRLDQQEIKGLLSPSESSVEQNRISEALLRLTEQLKRVD